MGGRSGLAGAMRRGGSSCEPAWEMGMGEGALNSRGMRRGGSVLDQPRRLGEEGVFWTSREDQVRRECSGPAEKVV